MFYLNNYMNLIFLVEIDNGGDDGLLSVHYNHC